MGLRSIFTGQSKPPREHQDHAHFWSFLRYLELYAEKVGNRALYGKVMPKLHKLSQEGGNTRGSAILALDGEASPSVMVVCRDEYFHVLCATKRSYRLLGAIRADIESTFRMGSKKSITQVSVFSFGWQVVRVKALPAAADDYQPPVWQPEYVRTEPALGLVGLLIKRDGDWG